MTYHILTKWLDLVWHRGRKGPAEERDNEVDRLVELYTVGVGGMKRLS
jgi:hypothetical protein